MRHDFWGLLNERHHPRRGLRHAALPDHDVGQQTTAAGLRQADDLLPALDIDVGRDSRNPGHHTPKDQWQFQKLLGDGSQYGLRLEYAAQPSPDGLAQAFIIGGEFVGKENVALALGDNIFYGHGLTEDLRRAAARREGATVFAYQVRNPERYGVVEFNADGRAISLEEKPKRPRSGWAVTGLYFYDNRVLDVARELKPSARGELEITDVNKTFLEWNALHVEKLGRGIAWLDTGTHESLQQASLFIQALQERQGLMAACLEEIAYHLRWITAEDVARIAGQMKMNDYGRYLLRMLEQGAQAR